MSEKHNVRVFNRDVSDNSGYKYTTNASFSSEVANERLTRATIERLSPDVRSILDVGCGDGTYTAEIKRARPGARVVGTDAAEQGIALARGKYPEIEFHVSDAHDVSTYPGGPFDVAVARGILHHVRDPRAVIANLLKHAASVIIIEPNGNNPILKLIEKTSTYHREHEEQSFSSPTLSRWVRNAGGIIRSVEWVGFIPFFFPEKLARPLHHMQPFLERIRILAWVFGGQIVIVTERPAD